jgi:hypothetical protein
MPRRRHKGADPAAQEAFKQGLPSGSPRSPWPNPRERVDVWFEDEARFGQRGTPTRVLARTGLRPRTVTRTQYDRTYVFTGVCPETGAAAGLILPHADTGAASPLLAELSRRLAPDVHAVLILDGTGYYTSRALVVPANITLRPPPAYAPELNPLENLWHYLRSHHWSDRVYRDSKALLTAATADWRAACLGPEAIKSVCAAAYLTERRSYW